MLFLHESLWTNTEADAMLPNCPLQRTHVLLRREYLTGVTNLEPNCRFARPILIRANHGLKMFIVIF